MMGREREENSQKERSGKRERTREREREVVQEVRREPTHTGHGIGKTH